MSQETTESIQKPLRSIEDWETWRKAWDETDSVEFRESLLHFGFSIQIYDAKKVIERICFYLELADGNADKKRFRKEDCRYENQQAIFAHSLSRKAFEVLCLNFFKDKKDRHAEAPSWFWLAVNPEVLEKLLWFFRLEIREYSFALDLYNLRKFFGDSKDFVAEHHFATAREFLFNLARLAWEFRFFDKEDESESDKDLQERFKTLHPRFIEILYGLGKIDFLLSKKVLDYGVSPKCLNRLNKLVMGQERSFHRFGEHESRKPATLEEAIYFRIYGSDTLLILKVIESEKKRWEEIDKLERKKFEAETRLSTLKK